MRLRVRANKGAAGIDHQSIAAFEQDVKNNLFKLWKRLSSGSYFPVGYVNPDVVCELRVRTGQVR